MSSRWIENSGTRISCQPTKLAYSSRRFTIPSARNESSGREGGYMYSSLLSKLYNADFVGRIRSIENVVEFGGCPAQSRPSLNKINSINGRDVRVSSHETDWAKFEAISLLSSLCSSQSSKFYTRESFTLDEATESNETGTIRSRLINANRSLKRKRRRNE